MTVTDERTGVAAIVAKVADDDEGAALTLLQFGFYEALCDEADRIRPTAERRAAQEILKRTEGALERLAKRYAASDVVGKAEASRVADDVLAMRRAAEVVLKSYLDEHNVTQGEGGKFRRKGVRGAILDMLGIGTRQGEGADSQPSKTRETLNSIVGSDADTYTRLRTLGQGLIASSNPQARGAGAAARIVGDVGPEAQRALEPGIRRTAYRYRGTERKPSPAAQRDAKAIFNSVQGGDGRSQDQARLNALGDFGASLLWRQIPDAETARISLEAGKMPPSVGMMFDADGNLVSEAMGFNGDHYLPFDLKNLKRLKGGSYVRTRTTGGPTDEDIYTALLSGARQIQVVSNSGNFVIEFDPSLRGGRRYSDKARSMVERYGRLVGAIGSGKLMQTDLKPEQMRQIRRDAFQQAGGDETLARDLVEEEVRRARNEARFSEIDEDTMLKEAETEARAEFKGKPAVSQRQILQRTDELFKTKVRAQREQVARAYRLDGVGYGAAMKALKTEFPYFIRDVSYQPLHQFLARANALGPEDQLPSRGGSDIGYTRPGELATYRDQAGNKRPKDERRGVRPARGQKDEAKPEDVTDEKPAAGGADKPAPSRPTVNNVRLPQPDAPSLQALAERNDYEVKLGMQTSWASLLRFIKRVPGALEAPPQNPEGGAVPADDPALTGPAMDGAGYAAWLLAHTHGSSQKITDFLADPANAPHRAKAKEAIDYIASIELEEGSGVPKPSPEDFARAKSGLDLLGGVDSLFAEGEPDLLQIPDDEDAKPQAWPEIIALGGSHKNLEAYARAHPQVAEIAAQLQDSDNLTEAVRELIATPAKQVRSAQRSVEAGQVVSGFKGSLADARQFKHQGDRHPTVVALRNAQLAWSLVAAEQAVTALTGEPELRFADVGPKAKAPEEGEAAKAFRPAIRVVKVDRESPIARALAARARRP